MFNKLKNAFAGLDSEAMGRAQHTRETPKYTLSYARPHFLNLNEDEIQASMDHRLRPIINPSQRLVNNSGYAECINGGKSKYNEDQAVCHQGVLQSGSIKIPYLYFALFDGHAGAGAAISAASQLHHILHQHLVDAQDDIWFGFLKDDNSDIWHTFIRGALEISFKDMDDIIKEQFSLKRCSGGCTVLVAISLLGYLYVANAGDSRAVICSGNKVHNMSNDFTPETESLRIRQLGYAYPQLLGNDYNCLEYIKLLNTNDLGKRILFRDPFMKGWTYKTVEQVDLKPSIITGQGKRSRVMATIGVTRGFGDHDLLSVHQRIAIKPFLSCYPEVQVYDLKNTKQFDVLVMGTDGLWDVVDGPTVAHTVKEAVHMFDEKEVFISAATCLVGAARGSSKDQQWTLKNGKQASVDDISVFVVPLYQIRREYKKMMQTISLRLSTQLPAKVLKDEEMNKNHVDETEARQNYLCTIAETIREKHKFRRSLKYSDLCFVTTDSEFQSDNTLVVNPNQSKDDFLLVNVQAVESIDVAQDTDLESRLESLHLDQKVNYKKITFGKNNSLELLFIDNTRSSQQFRRSRSYPGTQYDNRYQPHSCRSRHRQARYRLKIRPAASATHLNIEETNK